MKGRKRHQLHQSCLLSVGYSLQIKRVASLEPWMKLDALKSCWFGMFQVPIHPEAGIPTDELSLEHGEPSFPFVASVSFRWLWYLRQRSNQDIHIKQLARHTVQHLQHLEMSNVGHVVTKKHGFEVRFGAFRAYKVSRCRPWEDETWNPWNMCPSMWLLSESMESLNRCWHADDPSHTSPPAAFNWKGQCSCCSLTTNSPGTSWDETSKFWLVMTWLIRLIQFPLQISKYHLRCILGSFSSINCGQRCNLHPFDSCWKSQIFFTKTASVGHQPSLTERHPRFGWIKALKIAKKIRSEWDANLLCDVPRSLVMFPNDAELDRAVSPDVPLFRRI